MQTLTTSPTLPQSVIGTPILAGYYYAISDNAHSKNSKYTLMQISDIRHSFSNGIDNKNRSTQLKIQQFAPALKALPEFINPTYLGTPIAQFWLEMGEFLAWQPLLMQRGTLNELIT